jgi:hypothetical protein
MFAFMVPLSVMTQEARDETITIVRLLGKPNGLGYGVWFSKKASS